MKSIESYLKSFDPIGLEKLGSASLMDRVESKFWFNSGLLHSVLESIGGYYQVLDIEGKRLQHYQSQYFDTESKDLYLEHHNGRLNRYKVRTRYYTDSHIGFFEFKFKNNKGRTIKSRIKHPYAYGPMTEESLAFLRDKMPGTFKDLVPVMKVEYDRFTLVDILTNERVTVDINLNFKSDDSTLMLPALVIAEIKQESRKSGVFANVMREVGLKQGSLSKYCMGMALLDENLKRNNFIVKIKELEKICC